MILLLFEVDAENMRLVPILKNNQTYLDWVSNAKIVSNHMNWEIANSKGKHLGVASYDFIKNHFGVVYG